MKILVVEDDRVVGQYIRRGLEESQYHADLVDDGLEALRLISGETIWSSSTCGCPGWVAWRCCAPFAIGNTTPILVLTAQDAVGHKVEALRAGADDYVTKPFAFEEVLARVKRSRAVPNSSAPPRWSSETWSSTWAAARSIAPAGPSS